jgi:hypothetical protein
MKRQRILLLGLAFALLLAVGVGVTAWWPAPSEAESAAARVEAGETWRRVATRENRTALFPVEFGKPDGKKRVELAYADGSCLTLTCDGRDGTVISIHTTPPDPVHPLNRLRRTLARAFPFLKE